MSLSAGGCDEPQAVARRFRGFDDADEENGESRVLVGFYFRDAVDKGLKRGRLIGHWTIDRVLQLRRER